MTADEKRKYVFEEVTTNYKQYCLQRYRAAVVIYKHVPVSF